MAKGVQVEKNRYELTGDVSITRLLITRRDGDVYPVTIDTDDVPQVQSHVWRVMTSGTCLGAIHVATGGPPGGVVSLTRFLMEPAPTQRVTHLNGIPTDCRRANLVCASPSAIAKAAVRKPAIRNRGGRCQRHDSQIGAAVGYLKQHGEPIPPRPRRGRGIGALSDPQVRAAQAEKLAEWNAEVTKMAADLRAILVVQDTQRKLAKLERLKLKNAA